MDLPAGKPLQGHPVNVVFVGSCTNSRISDLRAAASLLKGRKVSPNVRMMVVPGSQQVKAQAKPKAWTKFSAKPEPISAKPDAPCASP
jgi:3-isopropylmalate/(R)-2-methylmalate dehydratase large subunit